MSTVTEQRAPAPVQSRAARRSRSARHDAGWGIGAIIIVLAGWEVLARTGVLPSIAFPSASEVLERLASLLVEGRFWSSVGQTVGAAALGLLLVCVVAVPLGTAVGRVPWIDRSTLLVIEFLKPIPPVALLPLALLFWGPSMTMKVFLVFMGAIWPLMVQIAYGARGMEGLQIDVSRSYRLGFGRTLRYIILPSLLPFGLVGLRVSASIAIVVAVVAELIGGAPGMGREIALAQNAGDLPSMYAYILTTGLLGLAINAVFSLLNKPLLFWHPSQRKGSH
jgi:ABC-type nitrate/sulfonate/bicarbonate transport system permease component